MRWTVAIDTALRAWLAAVFAVALASGTAQAAGIVTTPFGSDQILVYPTPNANSPNPTAVPVTGVPAGARPHGVTCFGTACLVADSGSARVFVVDLTTATVVDTIPTANANYSGTGTIAVNPAHTFALAMDPPSFANGQLTVIAAPFTSGSKITTVALPHTPSIDGTQAIAFRPGDGQAYVCTGSSIAVLNDPYSSVAFSIPAPGDCSQIAVANNGNTLLAPRPLQGNKAVNVFTAPFSGASTPAVLNIPDAGLLAGVAVTTDSSKALVVDASGPAIWAVSAPFGAGSTVEKISLPAGFPGARQIAISPDTQLAILAGAPGSSSNPLVPFVRPPFTAAGATSFGVFVTGGIGTGGATFLGNAGPPTSGAACDPNPSPAAALTAAIRSADDDTDEIVTLFAAVLPGSRSVRVGCTATAFVTVINASVKSPAIGVAIAPAVPIPAEFLYQTTNPATNALTGTPNTPANIDPGQSQSFLIAFTPRAPFDPVNVTFAYGGTNSNPVLPLTGINTLLLSASASPVPDIVALAASAVPGIVEFPGPNGLGAFAVASVNGGASADITVTADTGGASVPVTLSVCQTNPGTGACLAPPAASVTTPIAGNATPTFGIFVAGNGNVPFDPAASRVFVRFKDGAGVTRGATSVAVRSQ